MSRDLILLLARENPRWGYQRIRGPLLKLGHRASATAIRAVLRRHGVPRAPRRPRLPWGAFLGAHAAGVLACNFFTVETVRMQTLFVLFFIELHTRRVFVAGCTDHPFGTWITQQARYLAWQLEDESRRPTLLIHARDAKFPASSDAVFGAEGVCIVRTPAHLRRAKPYALDVPPHWLEGREARQDALGQEVPVLGDALQGLGRANSLEHVWPPRRGRAAAAARRQDAMSISLLQPNSRAAS